MAATPAVDSSSTSNPQASTTGNLAPGLVMVVSACNALNAQTNMQISDSNMVELDTNIENAVMTYQNGSTGPMAQYSDQLTNSVNQYNADVSSSNTNDANIQQANITTEQTEFQQAQTNSSNIQQTWGSTVQSAENQVSQDSSNEQQNVQTTESALQMMSALANLVSKPL